jgi:hypothetical protein
MTAFLKSTTAAALGLAMLTASIAPAHADRNGRIAGGIAAGVIAGAIIAGAAANARASEDRPVRVYSGPDCREFRSKARWAEDNGQPRRAQYYWDRYAECRGE